MGLSPHTGYKREIFSHFNVVKVVLLFEKMENKQKEAGDCLLKNQYIERFYQTALVAPYKVEKNPKFRYLLPYLVHFIDVCLQDNPF